MKKIILVTILFLLGIVNLNCMEKKRFVRGEYMNVDLPEGSLTYLVPGENSPSWWVLGNGKKDNKSPMWISTQMLDGDSEPRFEIIDGWLCINEEKMFAANLVVKNYTKPAKPLNS